MAAYGCNLDLKTNVIPRRTRRSTCKSEKCPHRKARCRFRTVPSNSHIENVRDGTEKNILDVHKGKHIESSPAIEPCSTSDSSFRKPESSKGFSKVHSNSEDQIEYKIQSPN